MVENMIVAVVIINDKNEICYKNNHMDKILNYENSEICRKINRIEVHQLDRASMKILNFI